MAVPMAERRVARRFPLKVVAWVRPWRSAAPQQNVELINFSSSGLYFASKQVYQQGDVVELSLKLPLVTEGPLPEWRCVGRVVRVQSLDVDSQIVGVAVHLNEGRAAPTAEAFAGSVPEKR